MKIPMPWLKTRLREVQRTPASLARHLQVAPPRVYEMIAGRRGIQPDEIEPTATFLEWTMGELLSRLPEQARVLPAGVAARVGPPPPGAIPVVPVSRCDASDGVIVLDAKTRTYLQWVAKLSTRGDISALYMATAKMDPWRLQGELVMYEQAGRTPRLGDYVVIYLHGERTEVMVRQLVSEIGKRVLLRQHKPRRDMPIEMKTVASMYRVLNWDDCVR